MESKPKKKFDCVEMKHRLQAEILKREEGLSNAEIIRRRKEWLENSDDSMAVWWRKMTQEKKEAIAQKA